MNTVEEKSISLNSSSSKDDLPQVGAYGSFTEAVSTTYNKGGIGGFYIGYGTTVMREIPFAFIQFPVYEGS
eukprot:3595739-Amphidinium_carterae.1